MSEPAVSVILATFNRTDMLPVSAGSVLAQSYADLELIVVDDASTEDVAAAVAALDDERVRCVRRERRGGPAAARNTGLEAARGRYVAFQDSDDEWLLDKLAMQMQALAGEDAQTMCLCGLLRRLGPRMRPYRPGGLAPAKLDFAAIASHPITYTQTWLLPRDALLDIGGFDERLRVWEDWDVLIRLSQKLTIHALPAPLVLSEQGPDSISHDNEAFLAAMQAVMAKNEKALASRERARAQLRYILARLMINAGRMREARHALIRAIIDDPRRMRAWALLAGALLGRAAVTRGFRMAAHRASEAGR